MAVRAEMGEVCFGRPGAGASRKRDFVLAACAGAAYFRANVAHFLRQTAAPGYIEPSIPMRVSKPPVGLEGVHEIKRNGYRLIARKRNGRVRLFTRLGYDWTAGIR
jgi:ATP-dependent DNA ligase